MFSLRVRVLSLLVLLLAIAPAPSQEAVAVLYARDDTTLYTVNPNNGTLSRIGALDWASAVGSTTAQPYYFAYDARHRKLASIVAYTPLGQVTGTALVQIDPHTAKVSKVADITNNTAGVYPLALFYNWRAAQLCSVATPLLPGSQFSPAKTAIEAVDLSTGTITMINSGEGIAGFWWQVPFFDVHGTFWIYGLDGMRRGWLNSYRLTQTGGQLLSTMQERSIQGPGTPIFAPQSFAVDPFTGSVFATWFCEVGGVPWFTALLTLDTKTFMPSRWIAIYNTTNRPLQIAWGLSR